MAYMGIMSKILGGGGTHSAEDYVELDLDDFENARGGAGMQVHIAEISDQRDVIDIKDAVYDGDFVIADITRHSTTDQTVERIIDELRQVVGEVDGDIVQKGDDQLVITPTGVTVSREKLGD
ncbi:cell division protein SepF [Halobacterium noricense]